MGNTLGLNKDRADRPKRKQTLEDSQGHGRLNVMGIEEDPDYYYRVVTDTKNRVFQLEQRGYEIVEANKGKIIMGDCNPKEVGTRIETTCNNEFGDKAVLMRIRREWKDEDDAYRARETDKREQALFRTLKEEGQYGEIEVKKQRK